MLNSVKRKDPKRPFKLDRVNTNLDSNIVDNDELTVMYSLVSCSTCEDVLLVNLEDRCNAVMTKLKARNNIRKKLPLESTVMANYKQNEMVLNCNVEIDKSLLQKFEMVNCVIQNFMNEHKDIEGKFERIVKWNEELYLFNVVHRFCSITQSANAKNNIFFVYLVKPNVLMQKCHNCDKKEYLCIDMNRYLCSKMDFEDWIL